MLEQTYVYNVEVLRVVDADTLDVRLDLGFGIHVTHRLRLVGPRGDYFDAWETRGIEREKGLAAKAFVEELVQASGGRAVVRTERERGKFGRYLASVELQGADLASVLAQHGHGEFM